MKATSMAAGLRLGFGPSAAQPRILYNRAWPRQRQMWDPEKGWVDGKPGRNDADYKADVPLEPDEPVIMNFSVACLFTDV